MPPIDLRFLAIFTNDFRFFSILLSIIDFLKFNGYRLYRYIRIWLLIIRLKNLVYHSFLPLYVATILSVNPYLWKCRFFSQYCTLNHDQFHFCHTHAGWYTQKYVHRNILMVALLQVVKGHQTSLSLCPSLFHFDETVHNFNSS